MKKNTYKFILIALFSVGLFTSCVDDDDFDLPAIQSPLFSEKFQEVSNNQVLEIENWTNFAQAGNIRWIGKTFSGNGYAEFTTFGSSDDTNIGWLVSPKIELDSNVGAKFIFQSAQHHLEEPANTLEVYISTDFDGTDVLAATWVPITDITLAGEDIDWYEFVNSGALDLSEIEGPFHVAFKATGDGDDLTAGFQIDNVTIYTENNN